MSLNYFNLSFALYFLAMLFYAGTLFTHNKFFKVLARVFIITGIITLFLYLGLRWQIAGRPPFSNMFESLVTFSWAIASAALFIDLKYKIKSVSALAVLMSVLAIGYSSLLDKEIAPLLPALKSNWLTFHVLTCFIGYAALTVAFVCGLILLFSKKEDVKLDRIGYKMISFGFLFLTLGIISGAVWANSAWGTYWSWDPKETWSLITWFIYAIYLHTRMRKGWKGKKAAWLAVLVSWQCFLHISA